MGTVAQRLGRTIRDGSPIGNRIVSSSARWLASHASALASFAEMHGYQVGPVQSELPNGERLVLHGRREDRVARMVQWHGWDGWEPEMSGLWFRLAANASSVFDIGAYTGYYAILAALANRSASIFAFEPIPSNYADLKENVMASDAGVVCLPVAVSDRDGPVVMASKRHTRDDGMATLSGSPERHFTDPDIELVDCSAVRLDSFVAERGIPWVDLVKIDVECAEPLVLSGMQGVIKATGPTIFIEVLTDAVADAIEHTAKAHCYNRFVLTEGGPVQTDRVRAYTDFQNYLLQNYLLTKADVQEVMTLWSEAVTPL